MPSEQALHGDVCPLPRAGASAGTSAGTVPATETYGTQGQSSGRGGTVLRDDSSKQMGEEGDAFAADRERVKKGLSPEAFAERAGASKQAT